jgi:putative oxidoreductase
MEFLKTTLKTRQDFGLLSLRVILALAFIPHALQKTVGWFGGGGFDGTLGFFANIGIPAFVATITIIVETVAPLALIAGFMGRFAALGIAGIMIGAITKVHWANGFFMNWFGNQAGEGFEYHLLVLAISTALIIGGSGAYSVDGRLAASR